MASRGVQAGEQTVPESAGRPAAPAPAVVYALGWLLLVGGLAWLAAGAVTLGMPTLPLAACAVAIAVGLAVIAFSHHPRARAASPGASAEQQRPGREDRERAAQKRLDDAAKAAASYPVFPTPVKETDDEKIARLVAECKARRGSKCDSHEEKRRMLLQNVDLTHEERRALRGFFASRTRSS